MCPQGSKSPRDGIRGGPRLQGPPRLWVPKKAEVPESLVARVVPPPRGGDPKWGSPHCGSLQCSAGWDRSWTCSWSTLRSRGRMPEREPSVAQSLPRLTGGSGNSAFISLSWGSNPSIRFHFQAPPHLKTLAHLRGLQGKQMSLALPSDHTVKRPSAGVAKLLMVIKCYLHGPQSSPSWPVLSSVSTCRFCEARSWTISLCCVFFESYRECHSAIIT